MSASDHILSVTELNRRARQLLEVHLPAVWVRGEISNLSQPSSGHWYFTLKDEKAQIRCAMFRGQNALIRFRPEQGMQVIVRGRISLYEGRGDYQLIAEHLTPDGAGNLQIAFEQLKARLAEEGLFDPQHKQALPLFPQHIGVITSPTGAALRDILTVCRRRFPGLRLTVLPVPVQGKDVAPAIARALELAPQVANLDVLILARGGGSLEDLWAFNEEQVARAVFACPLPVVSAVGHETDFTICDFVADIRAPTPSAAAELVSPDQATLQKQLQQHTARLVREVQARLDWYKRDLLALAQRLRHPTHVLREQQQRLDHLEWRLRNTFRQQQRYRQQQLGHLAHRLGRAHPGQPLQVARQQATSLQKRLHAAMQQSLRTRQQRLAHLSALLDTISPLGTLKRGYAIATDPVAGHAVTSISMTGPERDLHVRFADGVADCLVRHTIPDPDSP